MSVNPLNSIANHASNYYMFFPATIDDHWALGYKTTLPEDEDPFSNNRSEGNEHRHRTLILAVLFAVLVHLLLLIGWQFELPQNTPRVISVELVLHLVPEPLVKKAVPLPMETKVLEPKVLEQPIAQPVDTQLQEVQNTATGKAEPVPQVEPIKDKIVEPSTAPSTESRAEPKKSLYARVIDAIRNDTLKKPPKYKTFSTADFPQKEKTGLYDPVSYLVPLITAPKTIRFRANDGNYIIKKSDGFGNVTCFQERKFTNTFGESTPPLWYWIPASTCGHIK